MTDYETGPQTATARIESLIAERDQEAMEAEMYRTRAQNLAARVKELEEEQSVQNKTMDGMLLYQPLTINEVADYLRCTPGVIYRAVRDGELQVARVGRLIRITPDAVEAYLTPQSKD